MPEVGIVARQEVGSNLEVPKNRALVVLPPIDVGPVYRREGVELRLGMHTDSVLTLLRALSRLPDADQLRIEGRVLSKEQEKALEAHPVYRFYIQSRFDRARFIVPDSLRLTPEEVAELVSTGFSPSSLARQIGYKTGYFNAGELVAQWLSEGLPNKFRPIIGGINEFQIGSDTLSPERMNQICSILCGAFSEQEFSAVQSGAIYQAKKLIMPGFTPYSLYSLKPLLIPEKLYSKNENIIPKRTLFSEALKKY